MDTMEFLAMEATMPKISRIIPESSHQIFKECSLGDLWPVSIKIFIYLKKDATCPLNGG